MTITVAIIGLGIMGRRMLEHMRPHAGFTVTSLWDPDPAQCRLAATMAPEATIPDSADDAIGAADLVYLACPPVPRKPYALAAAAAGKTVFLEKPFGVDIPQSEDLVHRLTDAAIPCAVNFTQAAGAALQTVTTDLQQGRMGDLSGIDIIVTYPHWPRAWQQAADWLRFRAEGGMTREVISHFLFFSERVLGPLTLDWARACYPADTALCETHMLARLTCAAGHPVTVMASVGGAQPDRQELVIKGTRASYRITDFYRTARSDGGPFQPTGPDPADPRALSLRAQLDDLARLHEGRPNRLATPAEALRVQKLVEAMLA